MLTPFPRLVRYTYEWIRLEIIESFSTLALPLSSTNLNATGEKNNKNQNRNNHDGTNFFYGIGSAVAGKLPLVFFEILAIWS